MIKKYTLLRSQRSRVFELLQEAELEPAEFSWATEEIAGCILVSRLNHRDGVHYFQFSSHELNAWCVACPGRFRSIDYEYPKDWEEQEGVFRNWAKHLRREIKMPDPWSELAKYQLDLGSPVAEDGPNEPISGQEADQIGQVLTRLGDRLGQEFKLDGEAVALIRGRFAYLADAARRERCRDWLYTAVGICATVGMSLSLPREHMAALWRIIQSEVGRVVHLTSAASTGKLAT